MAAEPSKHEYQTRKRARPSYADDDEELDSILYGDDQTLKASVDAHMHDAEDDDVDVNFAPGKKVVKPKPKKRKITPRAPKPLKPFPFLSLPRELRDEIYEYALTDSDPVTLVSKTTKYRRTVVRGPVLQQNNRQYFRSRSHRRLMATQSQTGENKITPNPFRPALLATCKQIHEEAIGLFYGQEFVVEDTLALHSFIAGIGSDNRKRLQGLTVAGWGGGRGTHKAMNFASLTALAPCVNLEFLDFQCDVGYYRNDGKSTAHQIYRDGHYFLEAYGAANGAKDAAVDILNFAEVNFKGSSYRHPNRGVDEEKKVFDQELRMLLNRR